MIAPRNCDILHLVGVLVRIWPSCATRFGIYLIATGDQVVSSTSMGLPVLGTLKINVSSTT